MISIIETVKEKELDLNQKRVIERGDGPLWIIAGPGSGKTMVLVLRCLKLLCVDGVSPKSIIITTFTEKAAKNIQDRLSTYKSYLEEHEPALRDIDLSRLYVGTLHSICNNVMQEYRFPNYQNYRLLTDIDQLLFIYDHSTLAASRQDQDRFIGFWRYFHYLIKFNRITGHRWTARSNYVPHRWSRAQAAKILFNRICEDRIDITQMRAGNEHLQLLTDIYEEYVQALERNRRCDFSHLQEKFLLFLNSPAGDLFISGDGSNEHPGILHVLVDEYQDTNPIQEEIYLKLASEEHHNLSVVGDDDQALYRFRGGTVECMVNFDRACRREWGETVNITPIPLFVNHRSNPGVITWIDEYIRSFRVMNLAGARVSDKPQLEPDPDWRNDYERNGTILGDYPSVSYLVGQSNARLRRERNTESEEDLAERFAQLVVTLQNHNIARDYSQMVLLLSSTQYYGGPYQTALENAGVQVYNPRARAFLDQEEIQTVLGAIITIIDPDSTVINGISGVGIQEMVHNWISTYNRVSQQNQDLRDYVTNSVNRINQMNPGEFVTQISNDARDANRSLEASFQDMFYHILSLEPFRTWKEDGDRTIRLGYLSNIFEAYSMTPFAYTIGSSRGRLKRDDQEPGIHRGQLNHFYHSLVGLLVSEGISDPEDFEIICPPGRFPMMTIHQAKGLEFPVVFCSKLAKTDINAEPAHLLEVVLLPYRTRPITIPFTDVVRSEQDIIRLFYVAYSRAIFALVLLLTEDELATQGMGFGGLGRDWFQRQATRLETAHGEGL